MLHVIRWQILLRWQLCISGMIMFLRHLFILQLKCLIWNTEEQRQMHTESLNIIVYYRVLLLGFDYIWWHEKLCSKVSTPKCNSYPSLTARKATVNTNRACSLFQHKVSKVTNASWGALWGSQWEVKHVVLEGVQLSTSLVSRVGVTTTFTLETCSIFILCPKNLRPLAFNFSWTC
jgi:hypothetical protein